MPFLKFPIIYVNLHGYHTSVQIMGMWHLVGPYSQKSTKFEA